MGISCATKHQTFNMIASCLAVKLLAIYLHEPLYRKLENTTSHENAKLYERGGHIIRLILFYTATSNALLVQVTLAQALNAAF